jgi:membrane protein DedA with SNARE-associated domain
VQEFLEDWGYIGIFVGIVLTGVGFPMPEELPVVIGGVIAGHGAVRWWVMLPVCIIGVIVGDSFLYGIGRLWGPRLLKRPWVQKHLLSPERLTKIEQNFHDYGVRILLFARLTPGIRAPIFLTAGLIRLPLLTFILADAIYAVPGVSLLFALGFWVGDSIIGMVKHAEHVKFWITVVIAALIVLYMAYRFLRKPVVTGDPKEMPPVVGPVTRNIEGATTKTLHSITHHHAAKAPEHGPEPGPAKAPEADGVRESPAS